MANTINADDGSVSGSAGVKVTSDGTAVLAFQNKGTTNATLDASGNLGVGVASPDEKLNVAGAIRATSNATNWSASDGAVIDYYSGAMRLVAARAGSNSSVITFTTYSSGTNAERARIDSSGNLLVGDTSNYGGRLFVSDSVNGNVAIVVRNTYFATGACSASYSINLGNAYAYMMGKVPSANSGNSSLEFHTSNGGSDTTAATLDLSGNLTIAGSTATKASGTTWANPSDIRIKDDIHDYAKGLAELVQIRPRIWTFNGKGGSSAGVAGIGVIADEIESVLPETVTTYQAKLNPDDEEETAIKRFDASEVVWLLVNAVKELTARVAQLEGAK